MDSSVTGRAPHIEIEEDLAYQRRFWKMQRAGWIVLAAVLLAALLGLFGHGPLSFATAGHSSDPLRLEYERFGRYHSTTQFTVHVAKKDQALSFHLDRDYLDSFRVEQIVPEPERTAISTNGATYFFAVTESNQPHIVTLYVKPQRFGWLAGRIGSTERDVLSIWQFVFP